MLAARWLTHSLSPLPALSSFARRVSPDLPWSLQGRRAQNHARRRQEGVNTRRIIRRVRTRLDRQAAHTRPCDENYVGACLRLILLLCERRWCVNATTEKNKKI